MTARHAVAAVLGAATVAALSIGPARESTSTHPAHHVTQRHAVAPAAASRTPVVPGAPDRDSPEAEADRVDAIGRAEYSAIYGGISTPDDGRTLVVHTTRPSAGFEAEVAAVAHRVVVRFAAVTQTENDLARTRALIDAYEAAWQRQGIEIRGYGDDVDAGRVTVRVLDLTPAKAAVIERDVPADSIVLTNVTPFEAAHTQLSVARLSGHP